MRQLFRPRSHTQEAFTLVAENASSVEAAARAEFPDDWDKIEEWQRDAIRNLIRWERHYARARNYRSGT